MWPVRQELPRAPGQFLPFAGRPPFGGQTPFEVALHHVQTEPVPLGEVRPDLPPELCAIVHRMMAKKLEDRYQTCAELLKELNQFRESGKIRRPSPGGFSLNRILTTADVSPDRTCDHAAIQPPFFSSQT